MKEPYALIIVGKVENSRDFLAAGGQTNESLLTNVLESWFLKYQIKYRLLTWR